MIGVMIKGLLLVKSAIRLLMTRTFSGDLLSKLVIQIYWMIMMNTVMKIAWKPEIGGQ